MNKTWREQLEEVRLRRDRRIVERRKAGQTLDGIAQHFAMSTEQVRQICLRAGVERGTDAREGSARGK